MKRPILIGIGASHSGSGKTFAASAILRQFASNPHPSIRNLKWGAIKYTKTGTLPELVSDQGVLMEKGKDTWHMLTSGASEVLWVRSPREGLPQVLPEAVQRLSDMDAVIVEGNGAIEFLKPDIVIFILGKGKKNWKPGIEKLAVLADFVFCSPMTQIPAGINPAKLFRNGIQDGNFIKALIREIDERRAETGDA